MSNRTVPVRQVSDWWLRVWSRAGVLDGRYLLKAIQSR